MFWKWRADEGLLSVLVLLLILDISTTDGTPALFSSQAEPPLLHASRSPFLDPMPIRISPNVCSSDTLVVIHSAEGNYQRRAVIRRTFAQKYLKAKYSFQVLFVVGEDANMPMFQKWTRQESDMYGDILQGGFVDIYKNLTIKSLLWMRYAVANCPWSRHIVHLDDDVIIDVDTIFHNLINPELGEELIICMGNSYHDAIVHRDPENRWYVPLESYPASVFPDYCAGAAYVLPMDAVPKLLEAIDSIPYITIDDVLITGIARVKVGIEIRQLHPAGLLGASSDVVIEKFQQRKIVVGECHSVVDSERIWLDLEQRLIEPTQMLKLEQVHVELSSTSFLGPALLIIGVNLVLIFVALRYFRPKRLSRLFRRSMQRISSQTPLNNLIMLNA
ncbi:unnamed protein product, partial [Mesorhabditis spiculigera]